jgi:hypothetical protein
MVAHPPAPSHREGENNERGTMSFTFSPNPLFLVEEGELERGIGLR